MPTITISEQTMRLIRDNAASADQGLGGTATRTEDGQWELWVNQSILDRIETERVPGEPDEAVLQRLLLVAAGRKPN